jgi:hypothetical protein
MRLPRMRFTIRRMMVVVAVASVLLGITAGLLRRRDSLKRRAEYYARKASRELMSGMSITQATTFGPSPMEVRMQEAYFKLADHYTVLELKYKRAADHPWLPVGPDPPPPAWPSGVVTDKEIRAILEHLESARRTGDSVPPN